jgi:hypothetical protein
LAPTNRGGRRSGRKRPRRLVRRPVTAKRGARPHGHSRFDARTSASGTIVQRPNRRRSPPTPAPSSDLAECDLVAIQLQILKLLPSQLLGTHNYVVSFGARTEPEIQYGRLAVPVTARCERKHAQSPPRGANKVKICAQKPLFTPN